MAWKSSGDLGAVGARQLRRSEEARVRAQQDADEWRATAEASQGRLDQLEEEAEEREAEVQELKGQWVAYLTESRETAEATGATIAQLRREVAARDAAIRRGKALLQQRQVEMDQLSVDFGSFTP